MNEINKRKKEINFDLNINILSFQLIISLYNLIKNKFLYIIAFGVNA